MWEGDLWWEVRGSASKRTWPSGRFLEGSGAGLGNSSGKAEGEGAKVRDMCEAPGVTLPSVVFDVLG